ncbi:hypothetical protein DICVIV_01792 [Dictyocaulus viviparus]|uniref:Histone deacetylase domain-containing protein n=1 Tax=Dictyocaulus viviparus TaxID=29172 RepID=A0A0D8Y5R8_DICVI|nr:hypothetical protein DICVIV_01792 [Dictyocaulus viviparus]
MQLTPAGYATLTHQLMTWGIPLVMILEGGYFIESIAADFEWIVKTMLGDAIPRTELKPLKSVLVPVINRVHNFFGKTYPSLAMIGAIKEKLISRQNKEDEADEYEGTRDFQLPYPTRGVYSEREEQIVLKFVEELRKIMSNYGKQEPYKDVHYANSEATLPFTFENYEDHITLMVSGEAKGAVHLLTACAWLRRPTEPEQKTNIIRRNWGAPTS